MDHERYEVMNQWRDETANAMCCSTTDQESFVRQLSTRFDVLQAKVMQEGGGSVWNHMSLMIMRQLFTHCAEKNWVDGAKHLIQRIEKLDDKNKKQCGEWGLQRVRSIEMFDALFPLVQAQSHDINHSWIDTLAYSYDSDLFGHFLTQIDPQQVQWDRVAQYCVAGRSSKAHTELLIPHLDDMNVAHMVIYACEYANEDLLEHIYPHVFARPSAVDLLGQMTGEGVGLNDSAKEMFDRFRVRIGLDLATKSAMACAPVSKPRKI